MPSFMGDGMKKIVCAVCKFEKFLTVEHLEKIRISYKLADDQDILGFIKAKLNSLTCQECGALGTGRILEHKPPAIPRAIGPEAFPAGEKPHPRHEGKRQRDRLDAANYSAARSSPNFIEAQKKRLKELGLD